MNYLYRAQKLEGTDVRIRKEDLIMGRIVVAMCKKDNDPWIRAKILDYDDMRVDLYSVDYGFDFSTPISNVFYLLPTPTLKQCPFQVSSLMIINNSNLSLITLYIVSIIYFESFTQFYKNVT